MANTLLVILISGLFGVTASAHDFEVDGIYYNILSETEKTVQVTYQGDNWMSAAYKGSVTIPSIVTYNDKTFSVIGIGYKAFSNCNSLTHVEIPNGISSIAPEAFHNTKISSISIPKSVIDIQKGALGGIISLNSITVAEDNPVYDSRENCNAVIVKSTNALLAGCPSTRIPKSVTKIENEAFVRCYNLYSITIPEGVSSIGDYAFSACYKLSSITIPNGVTKIAKGTFYNCYSLTKIEIPNSVTSIEKEALYGCSELAFLVCHNPVPPSCESQVFTGVPTSTCKLQVPVEAIQNYSSTAPWSSFTNIEELPISEVKLTDGETYNNNKKKNLDRITYTRTFPNLLWNCLYVPFEIPYEELADDYDVAYINGMHSYDTDDDGEIDKLTMEWIKIKKGILKANYPYLIKPKNEDAKNMTLVRENETLYPAESTTLDCSTIYNYFEITGIYQPISKEDTEYRFALSLNGMWEPLIGLEANRFYLTIAYRGDEPVKISEEALSRISNIIIGDNNATGIEETMQETSKQSGATYDLSGRSVPNPTKGGVYIVNGKKVIF